MLDCISTLDAIVSIKGTLGFEQVMPYSCVIRLSLDKLLVNLLQMVKRTNTPLIPSQMASSTDHVFLGRGFDPHHPQ